MKTNYERNRIELVVLILCFAVVIIGFLFILDSTYPFFKYTSLFNWILCICLLVIFSIRLISIINKFELKKFQQAPKVVKLKKSIAVLLYSSVIIIAVAYALYLSNKDNVLVENEVQEYLVQDDINRINSHIAINEQYAILYTEILNNLCANTSYQCQHDCKGYFLVINKDTILLKPHERPNTALTTHDRRRNREHNFYNIRECGISLNKEVYNLSHPASRTLKDEIVSRDSISSATIKNILEQKILYYENRKERFCKILEQDCHISFGKFLISCLIDKNVIVGNASIIIRLLFTILAVIITFVSGYIYQIVYKILDDE